jgi:hypothetical protein
MDIYGSLIRDYSIKLDDEYTEFAAEELRSYIMQDGLGNDGGDETLETLMRTAERFLLDFQSVAKKAQQDPIWIHEWQNENLEALSEHAEHYQPLYKAIAHLTESCFVSPWAMSFIVESCVVNTVPEEARGAEFYHHYGEIGEEGRERCHYVVRFMENLIGRFFEAYVLAKK